MAVNYWINQKKYYNSTEFIGNRKVNTSGLKNLSLIDYLEFKGYKIPHYCYHKKLSIAGNCRMCLVELKNSPKPIVSCAMVARVCLPNSHFFTNSPLVKKARENIMEFLLLNHPLDCPVCDQGGECDLQDQAIFFGFTKKRFYTYKRVVTNKDLGPIVKTVMTRCIHCTRCVRFASEIAGVEELGIFGRGVNSEIGTYVNRVFQSELSGNVIDLCPVGALTSKPYPFLTRSWEIKQFNSIDFSDSFGSDIQVFLKNNSIVKILPGYNNFNNTNDWINDKTRFSFDGLFSPDRNPSFLNVKKGDSLNRSFWSSLFDELTLLIYCNDHLTQHYFNVHYLTIVFNGNVSLEVLILLTLISNKYSFIQIRKSETSNIENDLEANFLLNSANKINSSFKTDEQYLINFCILLGVNPRYEGSTLNLKLRQRYLKGGFKCLSIGSLTNLTYPTTYVGSNVNVFKSIVEGNNLFSQYFKNSFLPLLICSSEIFKRKDSQTLTALMSVLKDNVGYFIDQNWQGFNVLHSAINEGGLNSINKFNHVTEIDFKNSFGLYFINMTDYNNKYFKKLIDFKVLHFLQVELNTYSNYFWHTVEPDTDVKLVLNQTSSPFEFLSPEIYSIYPSINYRSLPGNLNHEVSGTYINTEGISKKTFKMVSLSKISKDDWYILRRLVSVTKDWSYLSNPSLSNKLFFNSKNMFDFKSFINFHYCATKALNSLSFYLISQATPLVLQKSKFYIASNKVINSKLKFWLDDFYLGGKDPHSFLSSTMVTCSLTLRYEVTNFG